MHTQHQQQGSNSRPKEEGYFYHGQRCQIMLVWRGLYKCKLYRWAISPGKGLYVNAPIGPQRRTHPGQISWACGKCAANRQKRERERECDCLVVNRGEQGENLSNSMAKIFLYDLPHRWERRLETSFFVDTKAKGFSHWISLRCLAFCTKPGP